MIAHESSAQVLEMGDHGTLPRFAYERLDPAYRSPAGTLGDGVDPVQHVGGVAHEAAGGFLDSLLAERALQDEVATLVLFRFRQKDREGQVSTECLRLAWAHQGRIHVILVGHADVVAVEHQRYVAWHCETGELRPREHAVQDRARGHLNLLVAFIGLKVVLKRLFAGGST